MIGLPSETRVWLASGATDMRRYAEHSIMLSPRRRMTHRRGFDRASLRITLGVPAVPQHGHELVRRPEAARLQEWRIHCAERFELFRRVCP